MILFEWLSTCIGWRLIPSVGSLDFMELALEGRGRWCRWLRISHMRLLSLHDHTAYHFGCWNYSQ